jgi:hypothetical protein
MFTSHLASCSFQMTSCETHGRQCGWKTSTLLGPLERANYNHWTTYVSKLQLYIYMYTYTYMGTGFVNERKQKMCNKIELMRLHT